MRVLYRMLWVVPTLLILLVVGCDDSTNKPPGVTEQAPTNQYRQALDEAEAAKRALEEQTQKQQQQLDAALKRD